MPDKSKAQFRFMGAVAAGKVPGVKPKVGKEFNAATKSYKSLPERVGTPKPSARKKP